MPLQSSLFKGNARLESIFAGTGQPMRPHTAGEDKSAVQLIQKALVQTVGPMPKSFSGSEPDGVYGDETRQFVERFQRRVFPGQALEYDGRVGTKTLTAFDAEIAAGARPPPVPPPAPAAPEVTTLVNSSKTGPLVELIKSKDIMEPLLARQRQAWQVATWARYVIFDPPSNDYNVKCLGLVHRCFKILTADRDQQKRDITRIIATYETGMKFIASEKMHPMGSAGSYIYQAPVVYFRNKSGALEKAGAVTFGRWNGKDNVTGGATGISFSQNEFEANEMSKKWLIDAVTHEFAHWAGNPQDHAYQENALKLEREKAIETASNYTWFAGLSEIGPGKWMRATSY